MRSLFVILAAFLALALVAGCAPAPSPTQTPAPTPVQTPQLATTSPAQAAATAKPIELRCSLLSAPTSQTTISMREFFVPEMAKRTNGRVKITVYDSEALGKAADQAQMIRSGVVDLGYFVPSYTAGEFPLHEFLAAPFLVDDVIAFTNIYADLLKRGYFDKELTGFKELAIYVAPPFKMLFSKVKPKTLEDMKGLKIRTSGGLLSDGVKLLGTVPVSIAAPDMYVALQKGTVDGLNHFYAALIIYNLYEVVNYIMDISFGATINVYAMNQQVYDKLPKDIQTVIDGLFLDFSMDVQNRNLKFDQQGVAEAKKRNIEIYTPPTTEKAKWIAACGPIFQNSVRALEAKGIPAKKFYDDLIVTMKKYGQATP